MSKPEFSDEIYNDENVLLCPECGSDYMKHTAVEVFDRKEDAEEGVHITVKDELVFNSRTLEGNPSIRRNGLKVHFECETCEAKFEFSIAQHKGHTFVSIDQLVEKPKKKHTISRKA